MARGWSLEVVGAGLRRPVSPQRDLGGKGPQGPKPRRSPRRTTDEVRVRDQHEDREGAGSCDSAIIAVTRGSDHRVTSPPPRARVLPGEGSRPSPGATTNTEARA